MNFTTTNSRSSARAGLLALILVLLATCPQMSPDALNDCLDKVLRDGAMAITVLPIVLHDQLDAAVLGITLIDQTVAPVANALVRKRVPFAFVTAYSPASLPVAHWQRPYIHQPFMDAEIRDVVKTLLGQNALFPASA